MNFLTQRSLTPLWACYLLLVLVVGLPPGSRAQPAEGFSVAPASGVVLFSADEASEDGPSDREGAAVRSVIGLDLSLGLGQAWALRSGYRTFDPAGAQPRVHSASLALSRTVVQGGAQLDVEAGGQLTGRLGNGDPLGYGPRVGAALRLPLMPRWEVSLSASVAGVFPDDAADGVEGNRSFDLLSEAAIAVRFHPFRSRCTPPLVLDVTAPEALLPYERGQFSVELAEAEGAVVAWDFGNGDTERGAHAERLFPEAGSYPFRVTVVKCGGVAVADGVVTVREACWVPPAVDVITRMPASAAPFQPVVLAARVRGTAPLSYRWRHPAGTDSSETVTVSFGRPGTYPVTLEVTNCTARRVSQTVEVVVEPERVWPLAVAFQFDSCRHVPPPVVPAAGVPAWAPGGLPSAAYVRALADQLEAHPERHVLIEGFADVVHAPYNWHLSLARAEVVRRHLVEELGRMGASSDVAARVVAVGRGEADQPGCDTPVAPLGCQAQRRVVLSLVDGPPEGDPPPPNAPLLPDSHDCRGPALLQSETG